jgi:hypothetical protein
MLEPLPSPDHVVAVRVSDTLDGADYDRLIGLVEGALARHRRIGFVLDLTDFHDMTLEAGMKDVRYDLRQMFHLDRFPRQAVITDKTWMRKLAQVSSALLPYLEMRAFTRGELDEAVAWAGGFERS